MSSLAKCTRCNVYRVHPAGPNWCLSCRSPNSIGLSIDCRFLHCWHNGQVVKSVYCARSGVIDWIAACQEYFVETLGFPAVLERSMRSFVEDERVYLECRVSAITKKGIVLECPDVDFERATVHAPSFKVNRPQPGTMQK